ncbi:MAG: ABC transporter ATP-binding protein [Synergistaceae bacterium]|jgi:simple sugar transport system ATP-binding protein|nr:ABC transporter ATP-binding protein [Synergistaceae bacterium]
MPPLVSMRGIDKIFFGSYANKGVDFNLKRGEVHALLGENGAGKTTLMNVLSGIYAPDAGTISIDGRDVSFRSPRDAIASGIGMVHQHFMLIPALSVWENMLLGMGGIPFVMKKHEIVARIKELSKRYALSVDPEAYVWTLSIGEQQRVEILKMLYRGTKVLILDEPTSVLTPQETRDFFVTLRVMTEAGHGVILISHKIDEILSISDRLSILRKGEHIGTVNASGVTRETVAEMMVGRVLRPIKRPDSERHGPTILSCARLSARNDRGALSLSGVSFDLAASEILGVAGVVGNGQGELCEVLTGLRSLDSGEITLKGDNVSLCTPREFIRRGVSYIPVDRKGMGLVPNMNLKENAALKRYWKKPASVKKIFLDWEYIAGLTGELVARYAIQADSLASPVRVLSGGNIQKLMLARELSEAPSVILAMHPVWGLDVGAAEFVHERILEERERGAGIMLISEDLDELMELSDRIIVMSRGKIMGTVRRPRDATKEEIGLMMAGESMEATR